MPEVEPSDFQRIVENCSTGIIVQREERVLYANPAAKDCLGLPSAEDVVGRPLADFFEPRSYATLACNFTKASLTDEQIFMGELKLRRGAGDLIDAEVYHAGLHYEGEDATLLNFRDITNTKRLELEVRQADELESVGRLAAGIAHELNTPIQYIGDSAQYLSNALTDVLNLLNKSRAELRKLLAERKGDDAKRLAQEEEAADLQYALAQVPRSISRIIDGVSLVSRVVGAMKSFSHPGGDSAVPMDVNKMLTDTLTMAGHELRSVAQVPVSFEPLPQVLGYPHELHQAFLNLVINAAQAIADGPRREQGVLAISTRCEVDHVEVSVSDNGCGMTPEVQSRLFEPFFTTKEVGKGSGQGLTLARATIVQKHGGAITFESAPGTGTTCTIRLPLSLARAGA